MIPTLIKDREREHKENRLSSFERGMNKQKKRKAKRERKKSRLDTVSLMMRRRDTIRLLASQRAVFSGGHLHSQ